MRRVSRLLLSLVLATVALFAHCAPNEHEIEQRFLEGVLYLQKGKYERAEHVFRELLAVTDTPRIRLELARALYYEHKYAESRALFREILADPQTPWRVRDNIERFLRRIEAVEGYAKFAVSLVSDSNPLQLTGEREFTVAGVRLRYVPPQENKRVIGLRYLLQVREPLAKESGLSGFFFASYLDFPGHSLDRLTTNLGISKKLAGPTSASVGIEASTFARKLLYDLPYLAASSLLTESVSGRVSGELKIGRVRFPDYQYLDSTLMGLTVSGERVLAQEMLISGSVTAEHWQAQEQPYTYDSLQLYPSMHVLFAGPALSVQAGLFLESRRYAAVDPFFGQRRQDRKSRIDFSVSERKWRWLNTEPALLISVERNQSNIDFYSYKKVMLSVAFQ